MSEDLVKHTSEQHPNRTFCLVCSKAVRNPKLHKLIRHTGKQDITDADKKKFKRYYCSKCNRFYEQLKVHTACIHKKCTKTVCEVCGAGPMLKLSLYNHMKTHENNIWRCHFCPHKQFKRRKDIKLHLEAVHMKQSATELCVECGLKFYTRYFLSRHQYQVHRERTFACTFCAMKFKNLTTQLKHERSIHIRPCDFVCKLCEVGYNTAEALDYHARTGHLDNTVYPCICKAEFYSRAAFIQHQKKEHSDGVKFYCTCRTEGWKSRVKFSLHLETKHGLENACAKHPKKYKTEQQPKKVVAAKKAKVEVKSSPTTVVVWSVPKLELVDRG